MKCVTCRNFLGFSCDPFCYKLVFQSDTCGSYAPRTLEEQFEKYLWYSLFFIERAYKYASIDAIHRHASEKHVRMLRRISEVSRDMLNTVAGNIARREADRLLKHG